MLFRGNFRGNFFDNGLSIVDNTLSFWEVKKADFSGQKRPEPLIFLGKIKKQVMGIEPTFHHRYPPYLRTFLNPVSTFVATN